MISHAVYGLISVGINAFAFMNYMVWVLRGELKPHACAWLTWGLAAGVIAAAQWTNGAGAGAWTVGVGAFFCLSLFIVALFKGERSVTRLDGLALLGAVVLIPLWWATQSALAVVVFATLVDALADYPAIRKSWLKPHEENLTSYVTDCLVWGLAVLAAENYSAPVLFYPAACVMMNLFFAAMILQRRREKRVVHN